MEMTIVLKLFFLSTTNKVYALSVGLCHYKKFISRKKSGYNFFCLKMCHCLESILMPSWLVYIHT
jgi:hypothetical protein